MARQLRLFDGFDHVGLAASPVVTPTALWEFERESYVVGNSAGFLIHDIYVYSNLGKRCQRKEGKNTYLTERDRKTER